MSNFHFFHPIEIRYGDLDPQGHVNNSRLPTFIEQARMQYLIKLGLWDGKSFLDLGLIVASLHVDYLAPIFLGQTVRVGVRISRLGNKSLTFSYLVEDQHTGQALARCETALVTYDYRAETSIRVPDDWRARIQAFEGLETI